MEIPERSKEAVAFSGINVKTSNTVFKAGIGRTSI